MGLLDTRRLQAIFGAIFAPLYAAGTLHIIGRDANGRIIKPVTWTDLPIRGQLDSGSDQQRADWAIPGQMVQVIVLQAGVPVAPTPDDEMTLAGRRWRISGVSRDPADTAWMVLAIPA